MSSQLGPLAGVDAGSLMSLFLILAALVAANIAVRRWRGRMPGRGAAGIELLGARSLGGQSGLLLVEVQGARYLVGTGRAGVSTICAVAVRDAP